MKLRENIIEYHSGLYFSWSLDKEFNHQNIKVYGVGVDILLKLIKDGKPYYFKAYEKERENGNFPCKPLFEDYYPGNMIYPVLAPTEEYGIHVEPNYPIVLDTFKHKFGYVATIEKYYIEGFFLPEERTPSLCAYEITKEFFKNIIVNHSLQDFEIVETYSVERKDVS